jgi:hypothetical protein
MRCATKSICSTLDKPDYDKIIGRIQRQKTDEKVNFLASHPFFSNWSRIALKRLQH